MTAAGYSHDGSLLALGGRASITLWQPAANRLLATLVAPSCPRRSRLTHLCFLPASPYLVSVHRGKHGCLCVWNLLTQTLWWSSFASVVDVAAHPHLPQFAAAFDMPGKPGKSAVTIFGTGGATPEALWETAGADVVRVLYAPAGSALLRRLTSQAGASMPLFALTHDRRVVLLTGEERSIDGAGGVADARAAARPPQGLPFGVDTAVVRAEGNGPQAGVSSAWRAATEALFAAPSHLLPPAEELCGGVLRSLLRKQEDVHMDE